MPHNHGYSARCRRTSTTSTRPVSIMAAGSPFGLGRCGRITVPPWAWQRSAQSDIVTSSVPPISASLGPSVHQGMTGRSEEHTSELQSHLNIVCRLLLEKKKKINHNRHE